MAENKQYVTQKQEFGSVQISEDVIATIVASALNEVEGAAGINVKPGADVTDIIGKSYRNKGIKITVGQSNELYIDYNINVKYGQSVVTVANSVQAAVTAALESAAGVKIAAVNVNVCGIVRQ